MELKNILRKLIKETKITIQQLSKETGVPKSTISTWLAGAAPRSLEDAKKVASYFGVSLDYLVFGEEPTSAERLEQLPVEQLFRGWLKVNIERVIPAKAVKKS